MTALQILKLLFIGLAALLATGATYFHHVPLAIGVGGILVGFISAAVAVDRDSKTWARDSEPLSEQTSERAAARRVLVIGAGNVGATLAKELEARGRYQVVGFVDDDVDNAPAVNWPILGGKECTSRIIQEHEIDEVFLVYVPTWQQRLAESLSVDRPDVAVNVVPSPYDALMRTKNVSNVGDIALVKLNAEAAGLRALPKRLFDVVVSAVGLVALSPIIAIVSAVIKLTSPGPVIFAQERIGLGGKLITVYKFRTMRHRAEEATGPVLSTGKNDGRLTHVGRMLRQSRLDEIPQLWNVLRGDMSLVGPRPERPCFVSRFIRTIPMYHLRHRIRPGITGLAQVCGGYHTDARDKLRFDLIYISNYSVMMDITILLRTIMVVLRPPSK